MAHGGHMDEYDWRDELRVHNWSETLLEAEMFQVIIDYTDNERSSHSNRKVIINHTDPEEGPPFSKTELLGLAAFALTQARFKLFLSGMQDSWDRFKRRVSNFLPC